MATTKLKRGYYRKGDDHRSGADVSFHDIQKMFHFRAIEIGKWVTKEEQQIAANLFFDALCDLMDILQVPEVVISLRGTLSLAFGSGGRRGACAHYSPQKRQLALAKNAGGGSLAHEWLHAFDHYICAKMFANTSPSSFASALWLSQRKPIRHPLNQRLEHCFELLFLSSTKTKPSNLVFNSLNLDKQTKTPYFSLPQEIAARSFEASVQNHSIKNAFLVSGTKQTSEARAGIYPSGNILNSIQAAWFDYFFHLGRAIER